MSSPPRSTSQQTNLAQYDADDFDLIPLKGKAPRDRNWTKRTYDGAKIRRAAIKTKSNLGVRLKPSQLVIDVDPRNGGGESFKRYCADHNLDDLKFPRVITGSGGFHVYMAKPANVRIRKSLPDYPGIDFISRGAQVVAAGSIHPETGKLYKWDDAFPSVEAGLPAAPRAVLRSIARPESTSHGEGGEYSPEQIAKMLGGLDSAEFRDHAAWLKIMQSCHHASNGDAREEFIAWSTSDPDYAEAAETIGARWDSLHRNRDDAVTAASLRRELEQRGLQHLIPAADASGDFDAVDDEGEDDGDGMSKAEAYRIDLTPYVSKGPTAIPMRAWVYRPYYIRKFAGSTVATGGAGKSSLLLVEAVAMASGKDLLGVQPERPMRVFYWNGEDPGEELARRVEAILKHYGLKQADIDGRLFLKSGRDLPIKIALQRDSLTRIAIPVVAEMMRVIREHRIDVTVIDPFVSSHSVPENDNGAIDAVAKTWADIADKTDSHVHISHHTRKSNGLTASAEDSRGASSLNAAMRTRRVLSVMTEKEAKAIGLEGNARLSYFKSDTANSSMTRPAEALEWYRFESVDLGNNPRKDEIGGPLPGDSVGVVTAFEYLPVGVEAEPEDEAAALQAVKQGGPWRENARADDWIGKPIAAALEIELDAEGRRRVERLIEAWIKDGTLSAYEQKDANSVNRKFLRISDDAANDNEEDSEIDFG